MAEGVALSWIDELAPMPPTPLSLARDIKGAWETYDQFDVPRRRRVLYCGLRLVQRVSYWSGWIAGGLQAGQADSGPT